MQTLPTWSWVVLDKRLPIMHYDIHTRHYSVDPFCVDHWSPDPPTSRIHTGDHLFTHRGNCCYTCRGDHLLMCRGDCLFMHRGDCLFTCRGNHLFTCRGKLTYLGAEVIAFSICRGDHLFTHRGNCLFMRRGDCLLMCRGDHLFTCRGDCLFMQKLTVDLLSVNCQSAPQD